MSKKTHTDITTDELDLLDWRESSFSDGTGTCVSVARVNDNTVAVRNSNQPHAGTLLLDRLTFAAIRDGIRAGELDHLG